MATTEHFYAGTGTQTSFPFEFPYLTESDVFVELYNSSTGNFDIKQLNTSGQNNDYSITNTNIVFNTAPPQIAGVNNIHIYRNTDVETAKAVYNTGSAIRAQDLNNNTDQALYKLQEGTQLITTGDIKNEAIDSSKIKDGTIVNADISTTAAIDVSKLSGGTAGQILQTNAAGNGVEFTSNLNVPGNVVVTGSISGGTIDATTVDNLDSSSFLRADASDESTGRTYSFRGPSGNSLSNRAIIQGRDLELVFGLGNGDQAQTMQISAQRAGIYDGNNNAASINDINLGSGVLGVPHGLTELNSNQIGHVARISLGRAYMTVAKPNNVYSTNHIVMRASYPDGLMFYHPDTSTPGAYYTSTSGGNSYDQNIAQARDAADMRIITGGILAKNRVEIGSSSVTGTLQISGTEVSSIVTTLSSSDTALPTSGAVLDHFSNSGVLFNVVDDTTPQLGGDLDCLQRGINNLNNLTLKDGTSIRSQIMFTGYAASGGPQIIHDTQGNIAIRSIYGGGGSYSTDWTFSSASGAHSSLSPLVCTDSIWASGFADVYKPTKEYYVTVATKGANEHRYHGTGSSEGYVIQDYRNKGLNAYGYKTPLGDAKQAPFLYLTAGITYKFDQSQATNANHQLAFYLEADRTTQYTTGVTTVGTAGSSGAYTQIAVTDTTPVILHYGSTTDAYMGNSVTTSTNVINANNLNAGTIPDARFPATLPITTLQLSGTNVTSTAAEINTLDGVTANTSELNKLDGFTGSVGDLNEVVTGKNVVEQITGSATDTQLPTAQAVNERIVELVTEVGGFHPIANETSFPTTNPDINDGAGTIVSLKSLSSAFSTGSGVTTHTFTNGAGSGNNVIINGLPASTTFQAGKGLLLETTSTLHTYNYHRLVLDESGVSNADALVSAFNERYYGPYAANQSTRPSGANRVNGDLYFNTSDGKMKVFNGSHASGTWDDVAAPGNFFINTLSSSSGSGGGSATFNNTATRFTLSNPPLTAQQLLVSVNGVIQKPNSGTSPSEGFAIDGADIIFASAPATGASFFIVTIGSSVNIGTPSNDTVGAAQIIDGSISNAEISSSAAIARTKLANVDLVDDTTPQLGGHLDSNGFDIKLKDNDHLFAGDSQDINIYHDGNDSYFYSGASTLFFRNANNEKFASFISDGAVELYYDNSLKLSTASAGVNIAGNLNLNSADNYEIRLGSNNDLKLYHDGSNSYFNNTTGFLNIKTTNGGAHYIDADDQYFRTAGGENLVKMIGDGAVELYHDNSKKFETLSSGASITGSLGIGTTSPSAKLHVQTGTTGTIAQFRGDSTDLLNIDGDSNQITLDTRNTAGLAFEMQGTAAMFINSSGNVGIGTTSPGRQLEVNSNTANTFIRILSSDSGNAGIEFGDQSDTVQGAIYQDSSDNSLKINGYNNATRMLIDSSGRVLIGTTTTGDVNSDNLTIEDSQNCGITIRSGSDYRGHIFFTDNTTSQVQGFVRYIHQSNEDSLGFGTNGSERARIDSSGNFKINDGNLIIGTAGHGIDFSETSDASGKTSELLDDYEEGTFTVTFTNTWNNMSASDVRHAKYIKIGSLVHCYIEFFMANNNGGWQTSSYLGGFPFTGLSSYYAPVNVAVMYGPSAYDMDGSAAGRAYFDANVKELHMRMGTFSGVRHLWLDFTYRTA